MAEVAELHLPEDVIFQEEEEIETLDSSPYFFDHDDIYPYYPDHDADPFSPRPSDFDSSEQSVHAQVIFGGDDSDDREACVELVGSEGSDSDSVSDLNYFIRQDHQVNLVFNLFERCNEETHVIEQHHNGSFSNPFADDDSSFRIIDENDEMGSNYLELGLELGLDVDRGNGDENDDDNSGFMIEEFGGEFYVNRRVQSGETAARRGGEPHRDGLRVVGIGSDSDEEDEGIVGLELHSGDDDGFDGGPDDLGLPLCWDCLRLEDQRESIEEFEWEEVDERIDEREVLNMVIDADEGRSASTDIHSDEGADEGEALIRTLEWEVLLAVNNLDRNPELEHDADHDDYIYPAEYEMLFGQFTEHESSLRGSPPAARSVLENLPSVLVTKEDVQNKNAVCAVCKDDIAVEEQVKQLPCSHYYHGDCILPWLSIRNTCPVCRYELPTDDPDYERMRTQRTAGRNLSSDGDGQVRYDFEIFREQ